jgi:outer membrane receptor protein involved in Fe transport
MTQAPFAFSRATSIVTSALLVLTAAQIGGQLGAAAAGTGKIVMSPFEVRGPQDHGYRAGSAITGTGTAGLIKDTPLNISIVSRELIADQGGNQLIDVLRGASSVALQPKDETMILIRGYTGPQFVNGLPAGNGLTLYDVDRVEVVKGPNAVFAGISNPGGTVNLIKLKPSFIAQHSVEVTYGSFEHKRAVFRTAGPLLRDKLAYSFTFGTTDEQSEIDYMYTKERFYSPGLTWRPTDRLSFTARYSNLDREAGRRPHTVISHPLFQQRDREAMQLYDKLGLARPATFPQLENGAVLNTAGQPIATGRATPETVDAFVARTLGVNAVPFPEVFSRDFFPNDSFNYNGPEGRDNYMNKTTTLEGEWVASPELAVRAIFQQVDSNRMRREFNGLRPVAGQRLRSSISDFKPGGITFAARLEAAYKLDLRAAGKHDLLVGVQHDGAKDVISANTVATARILTYSPSTGPIPNLLQLMRDQYGASYNEPGVVRKGGGHTNATYGVLQSSFLGDRLRTLVGGRRLVNHRPTDDNRDGKDEDFATTKALPQFGALVRLAPQVSLYGNISKTFVPQRQQSADLAAIRASQGDPTLATYRPPTVIPQRFLAADLQGRGWEVGTKFDVGDGQLLGTVTYFTNEESSRLDIDTVNQVLYQLPGGTVRIAAGQTQTKGYESEWVWTPRLNYQVLLSGSYFTKKNEVTNPAEPREVGSHLESVPRYTVSLWNKYTFLTGALKGAYVGGGFTALGESYVHPSWTVPIKSDPVVLADVLVGYLTKVGDVPVNFHASVRNLADTRHLNNTFQYGEPRTYRVGARLSF